MLPMSSLYNIKWQFGGWARMKALKGGHKEIAYVLLNLGINVKLANLHGDTALHWAVNPISFPPIWSSNITICIFTFEIRVNLKLFSCSS
jgi:hypothetical protein